MSQLLVVHGRDEVAVRRVTDRSIALFQKLCRVAPSDRHDGTRTSVAVFPRLASGSVPSIARGPDGRWAAAAGTFFPVDVPAALATSAAPLAARLSALDGMFVVATGDATTAAVATDRLGSLHAYRVVSDGCTVIATSSLVLAALAPSEWDLAGCREFLATGTVFEQRTLFRAIEKLPPATILELGEGAERTSRYWNLAEVLNDGTPAQASPGDLADALRGAVATASRAHARAAFDLTGGYDSRAVLGAALRTNTVRNTVVVGRDLDPDVLVSRAIAREYRLEHEQHRPERPASEWWSDAQRALALCDGEYDVLEYANILAVHERLARRYDASVNGSNGEICRGFWWGMLFPRAGERGHFDERRVAAARFLADPSGADLLAHRFDGSVLDHFAAVVRRSTAGLERHPNTARMDATYLTMRMQRWQGRIASSTSRIWPSVSPFVFREPMEIALAMPAAARLRNRMARRLIEHLDARLAAMPLAQGYPAQPVRITNVYRFWPAATEAWGKVRKRLPLARPAERPAPNPALPLWSDATFAEVLDPSRMRTASLYDRERLGAFLQAARAPTFAGLAKLGRVVTLELLARAVESGATC